MLPIAHRGCWHPHAYRQNTVEAMQAAVDHGWGIEIDVHRCGDIMRIGHDLSEMQGYNQLHSDSLYLSPIKAAPLLLWNIKTPGLEQLLPDFIFQHNLQETSRIFDQDFPGMPEGYTGEFLARGLKVLCRLSEKHPESGKIVPPECHGVWLDEFEEDWVWADLIAHFHTRKKEVYVVSPELHNRPLDLRKWFDWQEADGICTDFPGMLSALLTQPHQALFLRDPWWHKPEWIQSVADAQIMRE